MNTTALRRRVEGLVEQRRKGDPNFCDDVATAAPTLLPAFLAMLAEVEAARCLVGEMRVADVMQCDTSHRAYSKATLATDLALAAMEGQ